MPVQTLMYVASLACPEPCVQASAARALQRLNDFPELREQLANSSARDILADASASGSLLNTNAAVKIIQTGAAVVPSSNSACDAGPVQSSKPGAVLAAGTGKLAFERDRQTQLASGTGSTIPAVAGSAAEPAGNQAEAAVPAVPAATADADDELAVVEVEDVKQLAEVLANSANKWLREKAAAAVEQLAVDDPQACRCVGWLGVSAALYGTALYEAAGMVYCVYWARCAHCQSFPRSFQVIMNEL